MIKDLDDCPREGTALHALMVANGILTVQDRKKYAEYNPDNLGCSIEKPIVVGEAGDYVHLEYELLEYLLRPVPYRYVDYEVVAQRLICRDGKYFDALTVKVYSHPSLQRCENGVFMRPEPIFLGTEEYWFDVTVGFIDESED